MKPDQTKPGRSDDPTTLILSGKRKRRPPKKFTPSQCRIMMKALLREQTTNCQRKLRFSTAQIPLKKKGKENYKSKYRNEDIKNLKKISKEKRKHQDANEVPNVNEVPAGIPIIGNENLIPPEVENAQHLLNNIELVPQNQDANEMPNINEVPAGIPIIGNENLIPPEVENAQHLHNNIELVPQNQDANEMPNINEVPAGIPIIGNRNLIPPVDLFREEDEYENLMRNDQLLGRNYNDRMAHLGKGIYCRADVLLASRSNCQKGTRVACSLMEGVFNLAAIQDCTLTGQSIRNQGRDIQVQPVRSLHTVATSAIIAYSMARAQRKNITAQPEKDYYRAMTNKLGAMKRAFRARNDENFA